MDTNQKQKNNNKAVIIGLLIAGLLGTNAYWFWNNSQQQTTIASTTSELDESQKVKGELEKQYYESLSQLEEMKGSNAELNKVIDAQKAQLGQQKAKIDELIRSKKDLTKARAEMDAMRTQLNQSLAEIQTLRNDKEMLTKKVAEVEQQAATLQTNVATLTTENEKVTTNLNDTKKTLDETAAREDNLKKVIKVDKVTLTPINSKGEETRKAKSTDGFKVSFRTAKNTFAKGKETFLIQIISPQGVTIGNKIMKSQLNNGEEFSYTTSSDTQYNGAENEVTSTVLFDDVKIEPKVPYEVKVYHRGEYVGGNNSKTLKKGIF
jgi:peptidoglycan hydrolase CwlO-like protein